MLFNCVQKGLYLKKILSRYRAMLYVLHFHLASRFNTEVHNHKDALASRILRHPDPDEASLLYPLGGRYHFVPKSMTDLILSLIDPLM